MSVSHNVWDGRPTIMPSGVSLCRTYCSASLASFLDYPHKVTVMKFPVTSTLSSHLPLPALVFPRCQNSDRRVRVLARGVLSSAVKKSTALCASHNHKTPHPFSPLVHQLGTLYSITEKNTWSEKFCAYAERHHSHTTVHCWNNRYCSTLLEPVSVEVVFSS